MQNNVSENKISTVISRSNDLYEATRLFDREVNNLINEGYVCSGNFHFNIETNLRHGRNETFYVFVQGMEKL